MRQNPELESLVRDRKVRQYEFNHKWVLGQNVLRCAVVAFRVQVRGGDLVHDERAFERSATFADSTPPDVFVRESERLVELVVVDIFEWLDE